MEVKVIANIDVEVPEHLKSCLTFQTIQILTEMTKKNIVVFDVDCSEVAFKTVSQLAEILPPISCFLLKEDRTTYDLVNWQGNDPESGTYYVINDMKSKEIYWEDC